MYRNAWRIRLDQSPFRCTDPIVFQGSNQPPIAEVSSMPTCWSRLLAPSPQTANQNPKKTTRKNKKPVDLHHCCFLLGNQWVIMLRSFVVSRHSSTHRSTFDCRFGSCSAATGNRKEMETKDKIMDNWCYLCFNIAQIVGRYISGGHISGIFDRVLYGNSVTIGVFRCPWHPNILLRPAVVLFASA